MIIFLHFEVMNVTGSFKNKDTKSKCTPFPKFPSVWLPGKRRRSQSCSSCSPTISPSKTSLPPHMAEALLAQNFPTATCWQLLCFLLVQPRSLWKSMHLRTFSLKNQLSAGSHLSIWKRGSSLRVPHQNKDRAPTVWRLGNLRQQAGLKNKPKWPLKVWSVS